MAQRYYHAGPKGITTLRTLRDLINDGTVSIEAAQEMWMKKWGDWINEDNLLTHPTMDEISLTTDLEEAKYIASCQDGVVYVVDDPVIVRINEEGYPVCDGPIDCAVLAA